MVSSFQRRRLRFTFRLASGSFLKEGDPDTYTIEGYRAEAEIMAPGGYEFSRCRLRIYGIDQPTMERLSVISFESLDFMQNSVKVEASDSNGGFTTIFIGIIFIAQPDYAGAPDVGFVVEAQSGLIGALARSSATSYPGAQKVSVIMDQLAKEVGLDLENNGVESTLTDQYLSGTAIQKIQKIASSAGIQYWYVPEQGVLSIAPKGTARAGNPIPVNLSTGLVGWPTKTKVGVIFTSLFNPAIFHGAKIFVESDISSCNGEWYVVSMHHKLSSELPGGPWFTHFVATPQQSFILTR